MAVSVYNNTFRFPKLLITDLKDGNAVKLLDALLENPGLVPGKHMVAYSHP